MKKITFRRTFLALPAAASLLAVTVPASQATVQTWDGAASGVWDTSALNWAGAAFVGGNDALFTGTPTRNVTTATGLTIGAITLDNTFTGSVTLTGDNTVSGATTISGGTLTVTKPGTAVGTVTAADLGTSAITVNSGGILYIDDEGTGTTSSERILNFGNAISGAGTLQARASSVMTNGWSSVNFTGDLSGFTGTLNILSGTTTNRGKVKFTTASQATLLSSSATVEVANGAQLYLTQALNYGFAINLNGGTGGEGNGSLRLDNASLNVTGAVTLKANSTISGAGKISGNIGQSGGTFGLTKVGANTTVLTGTNSYAGGTTISAGTVQIGNGSALGSGAVTLSGGQLSFDASTVALTVNNSISGNTGGSWTLTPTNKITLGGTNNLTLNTNFGGLLVNAGAGGLDITGATTITGASGNQQSGYMNLVGNVTLTVQSGGSLAINGTTNATKPGSIVGQNAAGTSTLAVNGGSLTIGGNTGIAFGNNIGTAIGVLTVSSGTATITAGSTTLQNQQNFVALGRDGATGIINLDGGTLATGRQFVRDGSNGGTAGSGTATFNFNGGTLQAQADQTGGNGWFETATTGDFQVVTTTVKAGGAKIDTSSFTTNVNTVLAHDSGLGGTADGGLVKSGTGTLSLGAANTYTGATTVNAGTLKLASAGSIAFSASVALNAGGVLDTTAKPTFTMLSAQPFSFTINAAGAGTAGQLIAAGLDITNGAVSFSTVGTLDDAAYVIGTYSSLTGSVFASVTSLPSGYALDYNYGGTNNMIALVAVPEPHEFAVAVIALLSVMVIIRRRRQQA